MSFLRINRNTTELFGKEQRQSLTLYSPRPLTRKILPQAAGRISDGIALPASLTVEAALALTLFLLAVSCFWGLFPAMQLSLELQAALEQTAEEMAAAAYGVGKLSGTGESGEDAGELLQLAAGGVSLAYAHQRVIQLVGAERLAESCVVGGSGGLSFLGSTVLEEDRVDLRVSYRVQLPFPLGGVGSLPVSQRSCRRAWTGRLSAEEGSGEAEAGAQLVYVAEYGEVYHTTLDCTYLRLSVTEVSRGGMESRRNQWGERYTACQRCAKYAEDTPVVWITGQGRRYHTDRDCGGLARNVDTVMVGETALPPCSRCGGGGG